MKKIITTALLAFAGLTGSGTTMAQGHNSAKFNHDLHLCSTHHNFEHCMENRGWERDHGRHWARREPDQNWHQSPPSRSSEPKLSDMQRRALDNCNFLPPADQSRCRATVWSTVR